MNAIPFTIDNVYSGFAECSGLLRDEGSALCLEFETVDGLFHFFRSGVKQVRIPATEIVSVTADKGWVSGSIVIQTSRLESVKAVPNMQQGRIVLKIARKDRAAAEKFVDSLHKPITGESA